MTEWKQNQKLRGKKKGEKHCLYKAECKEFNTTAVNCCHIQNSNTSFLPQDAAQSGQTPHTAHPCDTPRGTQNPLNLVLAYEHNPCSAPRGASPAHGWTRCWTPRSVGTHAKVITHTLRLHLIIFSSKVIQQKKQVLLGHHNWSG